MAIRGSNTEQSRKLALCVLERAYTKAWSGVELLSRRKKEKQERERKSLLFPLNTE